MGGRVFVGLIAAGFALVACGSGGDSAETTTSSVAAETTTTAPITITTAQVDDPAAPVATSCEELADNVIASIQVFIDVFGDGPFEDWPAVTSLSEMVAPMNVYFEKLDTLYKQADSLGCEKFDRQLICERQPQLDPRGDAGLAFIRDATPCGLEGTIGRAAADEVEKRLEAGDEPPVIIED